MSKLNGGWVERGSRPKRPNLLTLSSLNRPKPRASEAKPELSPKMNSENYPVSGIFKIFKIGYGKTEEPICLQSFSTIKSLM